MAGGILQLIAKTVEDVFLTVDPQITLFKNVYRRHSNFSKTEEDLNFSTELTFGTESKCKIKKIGDLLSTMYLIVDVPQIETQTEVKTRQDIKLFLKNYKIDWHVKTKLDGQVTDNDVKEIKSLIKSRIDKLTDENKFYTNVINSLKQQFSTKINNYKDSISFTNEMISFLVNKDSTIDIIYQFIVANVYDNNNYRYVSISEDLLYSFYLYVKYGSENIDDTIISKSTNSTIPDNIFFLSNIEFSKFTVRQNQSIETIFNTVLTNIYESLKKHDNLSIPTYSININNLDTYKIYQQYIRENNKENLIIQTEVDSFRVNLIKSIKENYKYQLNALKNIIRSLKQFYRFNVFKIFKAKGVYYDDTFSFTNMSIVEIANNSFSDNFKKILDDTTAFNYEIKYYFRNHIQSNLITFYQQTTSIMTDELFSGHFKNNLDILWNRLNIQQNTDLIDSNLNNTLITNLGKVYILNFISIHTITDIIESVRIYVLPRLPETYHNDFSSNLALLKSSLINKIKPYVMLSLNDIVNLSSIKSSYKLDTNDILMVSIFKPILIDDNGTNKFIQLYICDHLVVHIIEIISEYEILNIDSLINNISNIVESFVKIKSAIPSYSEYSTIRNYRLHTLTSESFNVPIFDAGSSIWNLIQLEFITKYNNLYQQSLLNKTYYEKNIGLEMSRYIDSIYTKIKLNYSEPINFYELYKNQTILNELEQDMTRISNDLNDFLNRYDKRKLLLNCKNILLNRQLFLYQSKEIVFNEIFKQIKGNKEYGFGQNIDDTLINILDRSYESVSSLGPFDIINEIKEKYIKSIKSPSNPFTINTKKYKWYDLYVRKGKLIGNSQLIQEKITFFTNVMNNITPQYLYYISSTITNEYNNFYKDTNIYQFLIDYIISTNKTSIKLQTIKKIVDNITNNVTAYNQILTLYSDEIKINNDDMLLINSNQTNFNKLEQYIIESIKPRKTRFSWLPELGHILIDRVELYIGDQLIDSFNGEWISIFHKLKGNRSKLRGYLNMIGHRSDWLSFDTRAKKPGRLYIPLPFWFYRNRQASIPMIALEYSQIEVKIRLKPFESVCRYDSNTFFQKKPELKCQLLTEYIYIEKEERERMASIKHEMLIESTVMNSVTLFGKTNLIDDRTIQINLNVTNLCKEIMVVFQIYEKTKKISSNHNIREYDYMLNKDIYIIKSMKIQFQGRDRETRKDAMYYNFVQPYQYHQNSNIEDGLFMYSFSLEPELFQPSGCANLSKIDTVSLIVELHESVVQYMKRDIFNVRVGTYCTTYNILRIMSGICGLAWLNI
jgi:hypothetical protein